MQPLRHPIYDATPLEKVMDLIRTCEMVKSLMDTKELHLLREYTDNPDQLKEGEFAIGNWIVRPRF